jgi:gas vesicle protein
VLLVWSGIQAVATTPAWRASGIPRTWDNANAALAIPVIGLAISTVLSAGVGGWVALLFARRSSEELRAEAARLRQALNVLARMAEEKGWAGVARNEAGDIIGLKWEAQAAMKVTATIGATAEVVPGVGPGDDRSGESANP